MNGDKETAVKIYGIWRKEVRNDRGDWLRETDRDDDAGIIAFTSIRAAQRRAATLYGFRSYTAAKKADWCEVRPFDSLTASRLHLPAGGKGRRQTTCG